MRQLLCVLLWNSRGRQIQTHQLLLKGDILQGMPWLCALKRSIQRLMCLSIGGHGGSHTCLENLSPKPDTLLGLSSSLTPVSMHRGTFLITLIFQGKF